MYVLLIYFTYLTFHPDMFPTGYQRRTIILPGAAH